MKIAVSPFVKLSLLPCLQACLFGEAIKMFEAQQMDGKITARYRRKFKKSR